MLYLHGVMNVQAASNTTVVWYWNSCNNTSTVRSMAPSGTMYDKLKECKIIITMFVG